MFSRRNLGQRRVIGMIGIFIIILTQCVGFLMALSDEASAPPVVDAIAVAVVVVDDDVQVVATIGSNARCPVLRKTHTA